MADVALEFIGAARAFRAALVAEEVPEHEFARRVRNALARIYLAAALLGPPTTVEGDDSPADRNGDRAASKALQQTLATRFGEYDVFVEVFDPSRLVDENVEPFERSLSSELVEIDEDLADAIEWLERDLPNALWDVRWAVENHWGQHALACLRPLHQMAVYGVG
jgi:hypothetical protein